MTGTRKGGTIRRSAFGPGQVIYNPLNRVHVAKNGSMTEPVKVVCSSSFLRKANLP